jgi:hypothetical protein
MKSRSSLLFLAASILTAGSLLVPLWGFRMSAPQYPGEDLHLRVTARAIGGDIHEITTLQQYIGVHFPTRLPELRWLTPAILFLAALLLAAAFPRATRATRWLRIFAAGLFVLFLAASALVLQRRLYDVGHYRDPRAPIRAVHDFTPPAIGPVKVGNFTVWSYPHAGALALAAAAVLSLAGIRRPSPAPRGAAA